MSTILNYFGLILKWLLIILFLLFALATFVGKSNVQTLVLLLVIAALVWWPAVIGKKWNRAIALGSRIVFVIILLVINFVAFRPGPKTTIYTSDTGKKELYRVYRDQLKNWPDNTENILIETEYGRVHVLACGEKTNPPIVLLHAASMGAHSWAENLAPLLPYYRIFAIDNIGEGNLSELTDASIYPTNGQQIADLYSMIFDELNIESAPVLGASNGGYIAQCLAYYHPGKVDKLALFCPMGITQLSGSSIFMLAVASMYPFDFIREWVANWALGTDPAVHQKYGKWFNCIMASTIPSVAQPVPMSTEQKQTMDLPVLLFLGTSDKLVGDVGLAENLAGDYPNIQTKVLESGHMIAVEHADTVNPILISFLLNDIN
ncbi:alpha/beta fold hydrolase [Maribellus sediminis]|uniref:alpha/beta fold hydrolase n=1 Tax=Maribellus sediminis TaxID=2696285 RepID=UPI001430CD9C|nr:alpha/beta hydrolase [Maribellus sediminis]